MQIERKINMSDMKELKNEEWVKAKPIKYERFALIKDMFTFIKKLCNKLKK